MRSKFLLFTLLVTFSIQVMATHDWLGDRTIGPDLGIELVVYPNPTSGQFTLNIKNEDLFSQDFMKVKVVNLIGQTIVEKEVQSNMETEFDLSTLPKGFYFVRLQVGKQELIKRVVLR